MGSVIEGGVNFILTAGDLTPQYRRAIQSAVVHESPITVWYCGDKPDVQGTGARLEPLPIPDWLKDVHPAHIWDVLAFWVGWQYGGLVLGLDTISIRSAEGLLGDKMFVASRDFSEEEIATLGITASPYTMTFIARRGSDILLAMYYEAARRVRNEPEKWAYTGPDVLRDFITNFPEEAASVPYPALCGWNSRYIWRFYLGLDEPHPNTRVIHLFSQGDVRALYEGRWQEFIDAHPELNVSERLPTNDALLAF